jgi:Beta-lactamase superfamily domain
LTFRHRNSPLKRLAGCEHSITPVGGRFSSKSGARICESSTADIGIRARARQSAARGLSRPQASGPIDLAIMPIGAYNPWIHSHCTPEQAAQMANEAGAHFIMPVHHQTFRLSSEDFREPIERFQAALHKTPERIALREISETFVLP